MFSGRQRQAEGEAIFAWQMFAFKAKVTYSLVYEGGRDINVGMTTSDAAALGPYFKRSVLPVSEKRL